MVEAVGESRESGSSKSRRDEIFIAPRTSLNSKAPLGATSPPIVGWMIHSARSLLYDALAHSGNWFAILAPIPEMQNESCLYAPT